MTKDIYQSHENTSNRRQFLLHSARLSAGAAAVSLWIPPVPLMTQNAISPEPIPLFDDPQLKMLIQRGIDASRSAGATYSDVRVTHTYNRNIQSGRHAHDSESITVGLRALVDGYWGFSSGPVCNPDELVRLAREAVNLATINSLRKPRPVTLTPTPVINDEHWATPVQLDPFSVHPVEVQDVLEGIRIYANRLPETHAIDYAAQFFKQDKAFGSSEGSYYTQRRYTTSGSFRISYRESNQYVTASVAGLERSAAGFELFDQAKLRNNIDTLIEQIKAERKIPIAPVEVGRYDILLDARSAAAILDGSVGTATELDRALGYEANATGTSYINEPMEMLDVVDIGSSLLTVAMNRSEPGGLATVQWDDDGVTPKPVTLINEGKLTGFQTTREGAGWLNMQMHGKRDIIQSGGCSYAPSGVDAPLAHTGNLGMQPSSDSTTLEDMMRGISKGILFTGLSAGFDFQLRTGTGVGSAYEIQNGKIVARLIGAGLLFQSTDLWKSLIAVGGKTSTQRYVGMGEKGEPKQYSMHNTTAPPALFKQQSVIDIRRKA